MGDINWKLANAKVSPNFTVGETCWLPNWGAMHNPSDAEKAEIVKTAAVMEKVRAALGGLPITVTSWLRPPFANLPGHQHNGDDYNAFIGGARRSYHRVGMAVDFVVRGLSCDEVRRRLLPQLETLGLCMEDLPGSNWVHLDRGDVAVHGKRFFKP